MNLGENEGRRPASLVKYAETTSLFTIDDLRESYGSTASDRSIHNVLQKLRKQGRVRRLAHGLYSGHLSGIPVDRYKVPRKLKKDAVVAFHSALELHGVANQTFQTVYYLSNMPRNDAVIEGVTYRRVAPSKRLPRTKRLSFQVKTVPGPVAVTGRERAMVDCLYTYKYSGGVEELDRCLAAFPSFDFRVALEYLKLLGRPWLYARLGYLLDRHKAKLYFEGEWRDAFLKRTPKGVVYLERKQLGCQWVPTWNLLVPPILVGPSEQLVQP